MPRATLLGDQWTTYLFRFGAKAYEFKGGIAESVPPAVALQLQKVKDREGEPLFKIEDLPRVVIPFHSEGHTVKAAPVVEKQEVVKAVKPVRPSVTERVAPTQLRFML